MNLHARDRDGVPALFCSEDPELFFPDEALIYNSTTEARKTDPVIRAEERAKLQQAKALCKSCDYTTQCLSMSFMIQNQDPDHIHPQGVWGGMTRKERAALNGGVR